MLKSGVGIPAAATAAAISVAAAGAATTTARWIVGTTATLTTGAAM